ncbi:MAG TPA: PilN domain-containing protein [Solirubrobacterales bacterium]|jgi:Tfp pilus assembly protein PilN|nr:PilN domain-containing protein [Solirubrobacterales bacterium]
MRPVNLIPAEDRHDGHGPMRTGPVPYLLIGALVAALVGVTALVLTSNRIADRKAEVVRLEREDAAATARVERLAAYTQFQALQEQRLATVTSLADSRFDWERVMRELSLILPDDVWLVSLAATASPEASTGGSGEGGSGGNLRDSVPGPALQISGCASSQDGVAGFVTALKDIDGVTRVGVQASELSEQTGGGSGGEDCRTRDFIAKFEIVVAFDAAPVPASASATEASPAPPAETTEASSTESSEGG